jgi:hypothetical protein
MKKLYTLASLLLVGGALSAQNIAAQKGQLLPNQTQHMAAPSVTPAALGDTLFYFDGYTFYVTDPNDVATFDFANDDIDSKTMASQLSNTAFAPTSAFVFFYSLDANNDTVNYMGACSWFNPVGQADNWFSFGPITIPAVGATLKWQHAMPDNSYRDGYKVRISNTGLSNYTDFGTGSQIWSVADMAASTNNDTDLVAFETVEIPMAYWGQQIYLAFHHDANDMFILYLDEIHVIEGASGVSEVGGSLSGAEVMPNPATEYANISYTLATSETVTIDVYDVTGKKVMGFNEGTRNAGTYTVKADVSGLAEGVYYCTVKAGAHQATKKLVVVK